MSRDITAATLARAEAQSSEFVHLLSLAFSGGTVRFTTGSHSITWNSQTWVATDRNMSFSAVTETPDASGQRLRIALDGVTLGAIASLLAEGYIGRVGILYRAHLVNGQVVADPVLLFWGYMNATWEVTQDPEGGWCKIETDLVSPLGVLDQVRGFTADPNSHQAVYSGDTFFSHIATKPQGDFGWGVAESVPWRWSK